MSTNPTSPLSISRPAMAVKLTNQQRADLALAKGFCPIPLRRAGKLPAVKISAAQHGAAAWNREHAARYDFNRPGITVGIFLLGDALVFDIDAKVTDEEGNARFDAALLRFQFIHLFGDGRIRRRSTNSQEKDFTRVFHA